MNAGAGYSYSSPEPHIALIVVPSLDPVICKMGGGNGQYDPSFIRIPQPEPSRA